MERLLRKTKSLKHQVDAIHEIIQPLYEDKTAVVSVKVIQAKLKAVHTYQEKYDEVYEQLFIEAEESLIKNLEVWYSEFQQSCYQVEDMLCQLIDNAEPKPSSNPDVTEISRIVKELMQTQQSTLTQARLPKLDIKSFSGGYTEWAEFSDTFQCAVGSRKNLAPVQKLQYLKSCVTSEAASLIKSITLKDENYIIAWDKLKTRYDNKKAIRDAHFDKIFNYSVLQQKSTAGLRKLINGIDENVKALENLGEIVWDSIIIYITKRKLDADTRLEWERKVSTDDYPTFSSMVSFINEYAGAIESSSEKLRINKSSTVKTMHGSSMSDECFLCKQNHRLPQCPEFLKLTPDERKQKVMSLKLCLNCFSRQHFVGKCSKPASCSICKGKHHPTLHREIRTMSNVDDIPPTVSSHMFVNKNQDVLLATALVKIKSFDGHLVNCRVMLDPGSQCSFISRSFCNRLHLPKKSINNRLSVNGIGGVTTSVVSQIVSCEIFSSFTSSPVYVDAFIINKVTSLVPKHPVNVSNWSELNNLPLADKHFNQPGEIDVLLGADVYPLILIENLNIKKSPDGCLCAQQTVFGWVLIGSINCATADSSVCSHVVDVTRSQSTDEFLKKFWEIEEIPCGNPWSLEEKQCESIFENTATRNPDGRYAVRLPFREGVELGESRTRAIQRQRQLERRLVRQPELKKQYVDVINEYFKLGHAERVIDTEKKPPDLYYLPHHCVVKESSSTTKVRVVFDASAKSSTGVSLNDRLLVGPRVQQDLLQIMLRFRLHIVVFTADAAKMYRQVVLQEQDRDFHRFVWRNDPSEEIKDYRMTVVTFGIASSAHHATRVFKQLSHDEAARSQLAADVLNRDFYVDDCASGASSVDNAIYLLTQLTELLRSGGFNLRKVSSNKPALLEAVPIEDREYQGSLDMTFDSLLLKTLGIHWYPASDVLTCKVQGINNSDVSTKRMVLSDTSKVFDPLGLFAPVIMMAKLLFQKLWLLSIDWDDPIPDELQLQWSNWKEDLINLEKIQCDRCVVSSADVISYQLHGFADASESGYAAVVYMRCVTSDKTISVKLIASKTKVAPVKRVSIPRLELCAAALLVKLVKYIMEAISSVLVPDVYAWSDSTVTLDWICGNPQRWKPFVANRVSYIQDIICPSRWRYCPSETNPSDCASRGIMPSNLYKHPLWWNGPSWLQFDVDDWPVQHRPYNKHETAKEMKKGVTIQSLVTIVDSTTKIQLFPCSNLTKLVRISAWCFRWLFHTNDKHSSHLTCVELKTALDYWIKEVQKDGFANERSCLKAGRQIPCRSKLRQLNAFLDRDGFLRVGGRLVATRLLYSQRHPAVLPKKHPLVSLIVSYEHKANLHAGPQLLLSIIRRKYWILGARDLIRKVVHECVICRRNRPTLLKQLMGALPHDRVTPSAAFVTTGIDYAGPFSIKAGVGRSKRIEKAWIALFICFATKAIHIELVSALSTNAFLAALRRFVARRGKPSRIYSDNGTNFVGADREMKQNLKRLLQESDEFIRKQLQEDSIEWNFSPPTGSHFGGLWEAGVKSVRYHLNRIVGQARLTFEEMTTVLCQIEACLNSRPLMPLSSDPSDLTVLTPGHFLINRPVNFIPEQDLTDVQPNRLNRWQHLQMLQQHFWQRWSREYLACLQQRPKWQQEKRNLKINDLVIVSEKGLPSAKWSLARVTRLHPGNDGVVRVVTIKTQNGVYRRPITKLSLLVADEE